MTEKQFQPGQQHPEEWRDDLNPNAMKGQNQGMASNHPEKDAPTAYDIKAIHDMLDNITDDNLRQIPVLPAGTRLDQGAIYIDLRDPGRKEFKARGDMEAGPDNWYVPKSAVDYQLWNELIGVQNPERLGTADE